MSIADYIVLAVVAVCVTLAVYRIFRHRGSPCSGCSGDCMNCHKKGRE